MADNVGVRPSTTTGSVSVATKEVGSVHYPEYMLVNQAGESLVDTTDSSVRTIEHEHAEIHEGHGYQLSGTLTMTNGQEAYFLIDPSVPIHWRDYRFISDGSPIEIELFENPTVTDPGAAITAYNRNRLSTNTTTAVISSPTPANVTDDGTRLYVTRIIGGGFLNDNGEVSGPSVEWIIDGGNTYALKVTCNDAGGADIVYQFFWYEHPL